MRLARDSRYAIEALLVLADRAPGEFVDAREIGQVADLPLAYLHKIMRTLAEGGVLESRRGRGYLLARPPEEITIKDVLLAVEGPDVFDGRCLFWREECSSEDPCELHFRWRELRPQIEETVGGTTLAEVHAAQTSAGA
jgi:Rrf2 family iron-sulfur cluster assembly transcriptional regulator